MSNENLLEYFYSIVNQSIVTGKSRRNLIFVAALYPGNSHDHCKASRLIMLLIDLFVIKFSVAVS